MKLTIDAGQLFPATFGFFRADAFIQVYACEYVLKRL
jgi:hypothetical protein